MREINLDLVTNTVSELIFDACCNIGDKELQKIKEAINIEESLVGKNILNQIVENDILARKLRIPMCQDTGVSVVFLEIGSLVTFKGDIYEAVNKGVRDAYVNGYLRKSIVANPLTRINTNDNTPAVIHTKIVEGDKIKIIVAPKGGGSENCSLVKMLIPSDGIPGIKKLVLETIFLSGGKPCPPIIVGVGIGGNLEKSALLAKEALFRDLDDEADDPETKKLEKELLKEINDLGVGPMGMGGRVTALAVKINTYPCHIASLPVAINLQCHAARHKTRVI
ncbi:MAG: fumarate hydratase [Bacilli bacterium]|nr:fumarate hydratase [Bacilli bacterium]